MVRRAHGMPIWCYGTRPTVPGDYFSVASSYVVVLGLALHHTRRSPALAVPKAAVEGVFGVFSTDNAKATWD